MREDLAIRGVTRAHLRIDVLAALIGRVIKLAWITGRLQALAKARQRYPVAVGGHRAAPAGLHQRRRFPWSPVDLEVLELQQKTARREARPFLGNLRLIPDDADGMNGLRLVQKICGDPSRLAAVVAKRVQGEECHRHENPAERSSGMKHDPAATSARRIKSRIGLVRQRSAIATPAIAARVTPASGKRGSGAPGVLIPPAAGLREAPRFLHRERPRRGGPGDRAEAWQACYFLPKRLQPVPFSCLFCWTLSWPSRLCRPR